MDQNRRPILQCRELFVYQNAFKAAMQIHRLTENFPAHEKYSLVDQIRRSSRSVCANLAEAWRKRCYRAAFIAKLNDAESEAGETQVWIEFCEACAYVDQLVANNLYSDYHRIISQLMRMKKTADNWVLR
jgi:four helix bundle protein